MGAIPRVHVLIWAMELLEDGYTCWTLAEPSGRRWGWVISSTAAGWAAHVGNWGQAQSLGLPGVPVDEELEHRDTAAAGRSWVEENLARQWAGKLESMTNEITIRE